jgi:small nuclear ribonucleoprotein (snRNP)-like protein
MTLRKCSPFQAIHSADLKCEVVRPREPAAYAAISVRPLLLSDFALEASIPSFGLTTCEPDGALHPFHTYDCAHTDFVVSRINEEVIIRLKWGQTEYKGRLISVDSYMNVQLNETEEFINGKSTGTLGQVLIRYATNRVGHNISSVQKFGDTARRQ